MSLEAAGGYPKNIDLLKKEMSRLLKRLPERKGKIIELSKELGNPQIKLDRKLTKLIAKI